MLAGQDKDDLAFEHDGAKLFTIAASDTVDDGTEVRFVREKDNQIFKFP